MSSSVPDFLDRFVRANQEIVTYRMVARELKMPAIDAQLAMKTYLDASKDAVWATYVVAGDDANASRQFILTPQDALESTKAQLTTVASVQVYSLSPAPVKDVSFIALAARRVRTADAKLTPLRPANTSAAVPKRPTAEPVAKPVEEPKPKARGTLDFSKAKPKAAAPVTKPSPAATASTSAPKRAPSPVESKPAPLKAEAKAKPEPKPKAEPKPKSEPKQKAEPKPAPPPKAEPKAKAPVLKVEPKEEPASQESEREDDENGPVAGGSRLKRRMVISDEEDEEPRRPAPKSKKPVHRKVQVSDDEMDVDEEEDAEPVDMYEDTEPQVKAQRKKKSKVDVPMGSNGRPKKRVIKERMIKDAKGYMVSEDYSEYETDNDPPAAEKPQEKEKPKPKVAARPKPEPKKTGGKPAAQGQQKMSNFFAKNKK